MAYVVTSACIDELTFVPECERVCAVGAVKRGQYTRLIDPVACVNCGDCDPVCPVGAIFPESRVPQAEWEWIARNRNWRAEALPLNP